MRVYRGFLPGCLAGLTATAIVWALAPRPPRVPPPLFPRDSTASVAITLEEIVDGRPAVPVTSTDPVKIEALAAVLRRGVSTPDHKCADAGDIKFRSIDGSETALGFLAGHDPKYYEYRFRNQRGYDNFRVDRAAFLKAMAGLSVARIALHD